MQFKMNPTTGELDIVGAAGSGVALANFKTGKTPTPAVDGATTVFTTPDNYVAGSLRVTRGSLRMYPTTDFSETSANTFTMVVAPESTEPLLVDYIKA